jgi:glycosyltransferase involved in cell wall biosynthesis
VIAVDNGSTPETREYLAGLGDKITFIVNPENRGFSHACNQGAAAAGPELLLFLNNDTVPQTGWLEAMLDVIESDPLAGAVGSKLVFPDRTVQHCGIVISHLHIPYQHYRGCPENLACVNQTREFQAVTGACLMVPRALFREIGGFEEGYLNGCEDVDLCFKIRAAGRRVIYAHRSVLIHYEGKSENRQARMKENSELFAQKWGGVMKNDDLFYIEQDNMDGEVKNGMVFYKNNFTGEVYPPPEYHLRQVASWYAEGKLDAVIASLEKIMALDPYHKYALRTMGEICLRKNDAKNGYRFYYRLGELFPGNASVRTLVEKLKALAG